VERFDTKIGEGTEVIDAEANNPLGRARVVSGVVSVTSVSSAVSVLNLRVLHIAPGVTVSARAGEELAMTCSGPSQDSAKITNPA
jgi:hypothetical protein